VEAVRKRFGAGSALSSGSRPRREDPRPAL